MRDTKKEKKNTSVLEPCYQRHNKCVPVCIYATVQPASAQHKGLMVLTLPATREGVTTFLCVRRHMWMVLQVIAGVESAGEPVWV